jgi:hypothetical protein
MSTIEAQFVRHCNISGGLEHTTTFAFLAEITQAPEDAPLVAGDLVIVESLHDSQFKALRFSYFDHAWRKHYSTGAVDKDSPRIVAKV